MIIPQIGLFWRWNQPQKGKIRMV